AGLFHRAIMESGACKFLPSKASAQQQGAKVATAVGCGTAADVPACLRALPAQTLITALPGDPSPLGSSPYQSVIDGSILVEQPADAMAAGRHHAVPILIGANADETNAAAPPRMTEDQYEAAIHTQYGTTVGDRVLAQYPASRFNNSPRAAYVRATTDSRFVCPARESARAADAGQTQPVYRYFFQYTGSSPLGAVHGLDVPYVFGTFNALTTASGQPYAPTAGDLAVSAAIQGAWASFARTGTPATTPAWPSWTPTTDPTMQIDAALSVVNGIRTSDCDFWQPIYNTL
ncbi:MAG TPA: carboxylesterase family protein, partial [Kofleriaceae bacterium]